MAGLTLGNRTPLPRWMLPASVLYLLYAAAYIVRRGVDLNGTWTPTLFDDALVSMRYARNLAEGHGLLWNPGEAPVEGITNLLWTLYMALLHSILPAGAPVILSVQATGALLGLACGILAWRAATMLAPERGVTGAAAFALTVSYLPLNTWTLQGMEVALLATLLGTATISALEARAAGRTSRITWVLLSLSIILRLDAVVPAVLLTTTLALTDPERRRSHLVAGAGTVLGTTAALSAFRLAYFGDALPNTYYLKLTGYPLYLRLSRGLYVTLEFFRSSTWVVLALPLLVSLLSRNPGRTTICVLFLGQLAYNVWVGGDMVEEGGASRYVCIIVPLVFALLADTTAELAVHTRTLWAGCLRSPRATGAAAAALTLAGMVSLNSYGGARTLKEALLLKPSFHWGANQNNLRRARAIETITTEDARVAVVWGGAIPYFANRPSIDLLGKSDPVIARLPANLPDEGSPLTSFVPGHNKWDYGWSIGELKPDLVTHLWLRPREAEELLRADYVEIRVAGATMYARKGSTRIRWEHLQTGGPGEAGR